MSRKLRMDPSEEALDHIKQTKYCLSFSKQQIESIKKREFMDKICLDYSLRKISKEKFYGSVLPYSNRVFPEVQFRGNKMCHNMYSSDQVKQTRNKIKTHRYQTPMKQSMKQENNFYIVSRKKQERGLNQFWARKNDPNKQQKLKQTELKTNKKKKNDRNTENSIQQAFMRLVQYSKLGVTIENALIPRNIVTKYISSIFGENFSLWFISFYQIKQYINEREFQQICETFANNTLRQCHLVSFFLYDSNSDGFICPRDIFAVFQRQLSTKIDQDILKIGHYTKSHIGRQNNINEEYKIESICIRDDWLTVKDYHMYFRKVDEPLLQATNKKDTVFSKSFTVIDHREKVRFKRRQTNEKKNYYDQLYGQIAKLKNQAHIDTENDYKLNYSIFIDIFGKATSELYNYFIMTVFGLDNKQFK